MGAPGGAGNELALALDLRYASLESAYFGQPEVGIGILPGGGTERLPRLLGRDCALEVIRTSSDYGAAQAERWGWVTRALPDDRAGRAFVDDMVARLAASDARALAAAKAAVNRQPAAHSRHADRCCLSLDSRRW